MKALLMALALTCATVGAAQAEVSVGPSPEASTESTCPNESHIRHAAAEMKASDVVPLRSSQGSEFLMLVLRTGNGLVVAKSAQGCFDTMLAMPKEAVAEVLISSQAT